MNNMTKTILLIASSVFFTTAQENSGEKTGSSGDEQKIDQLFNQIMMTLPGEARAKIDSASGSSAQNGQNSESEKTQSSEISVSQRRDALVNELPDELRMQVEKTISDMEKRRNERSLQFKEYKKK